MDELVKYSLTLFLSGDKLRVTSLFHLLRGKRTSSVLMYGYLHQLLPYFGLFPKLDSEHFNDLLTELSNRGYILETESNYGQITDLGVEVAQNNNRLTLNWLDGVHLANISKDYFSMLLFATQVLSELSFHNSQYVPIENNNYRQEYMKIWLNQQLKKDDQLVNHFYHEWVNLVQDIPNDVTEPNQLVSLLTGHQKIGDTYWQQYHANEDNQLEAYLSECNMQHYIVKTVQQQQEKYPLFASLFQVVSQYAGNHSAKISYDMFVTVQSIEKVMLNRKLKKSTVVDHLIEGLILDENHVDFSFISKETFVFLSKYLLEHSDYKEWRYADIINENKEIDFFLFRAFQIMKIREANE